MTARDYDLADLPRVEFEIFKFIEIVWFLIAYDHQMEVLRENFRRHTRPYIVVASSG